MTHCLLLRKGSRRKYMRSIWRRTSRSASRSASEGIDRIPCRWRAQIGLPGFAVDHVNAFRKQAGDVILQADVVEKRDVGLGVDIDHDVDVAVRTVFAAGHGAEHGSMRDPRARKVLSCRRRVAMTS